MRDATFNSKGEIFGLAASTCRICGATCTSLDKEWVGDLSLTSKSAPRARPRGAGLWPHPYWTDPFGPSTCAALRALAGSSSCSGWASGWWARVGDSPATVVDATTARDASSIVVAPLLSVVAEVGSQRRRLVAQRLFGHLFPIAAYGRQTPLSGLASMAASRSRPLVCKVDSSQGQSAAHH